MAAHNDFEWFRGEDVLITFTHTAGVDITAWTISFKLRTTIGSPTVLATIPCTVTSGLGVGSSGGTYTAVISAAMNTTTLSSGSYTHSATRTDSGSVAVLEEGSVVVKPSAQLA